MELRPSDVGAAFSDQLVTASGTYELHAGSGASFGPSRKLPCGQAPTRQLGSCRTAPVYPTVNRDLSPAA